jgi:anthranilate phosphoribosyltransferase
MIQEAIAKLIASADATLNEKEAIAVADEIMSGTATACQIASFITALRIRGETVPVIVGFVRTVRNKAVKIDAPSETVVLDTCGTGGDQAHTYNISTAAALIAAGAGIKVAKHGNRSVSSRCGSADVLAALGVNIEVPREVSQRCLDELGICFLFAPLYHQAMKYALQPRREIGIRTIFNIVGPLSNPAAATHQLIGVYEPRLTALFAEVLRELGTKRALVVHGNDNLDEITTTTSTQVAELREDGSLHTYTVKPEDFGFARATLADLKGKDVETNAAIIEAILSGEQGPRADIALLNAGAAIYVAGRAQTFREGITAARNAIQSGEAKRKLEGLRRITRPSHG